MNRQIIITASILGMLGVIAGAFAAHGLKQYLTAQQLEIWHTGVQYQFYHVFALLFLATMDRGDKLIRISYYLFSFGIHRFPSYIRHLIEDGTRYIIEILQVEITNGWVRVNFQE